MAEKGGKPNGGTPEQKDDLLVQLEALTACTEAEKLRDAVDTLRLSIKYVLFDLEATRREAEFLRRMIEQQNRFGRAKKSASSRSISKQKDDLVPELEAVTAACGDPKQLQEAIDTLRVNVKYLLFDLEATARESGYLRKMLEQQGQ